MILIIEKEANNLFSITYDGGEPIRTEQNRLTTIGDFSNFKTANGANLVLKQNIPVTEITVIASGTFTFTTMPQLWNKLIQIGFFDGVTNSGGGSVIDRFDELADTFNYFGRDGQVVTVNESQLRLETQPISLFTPADRDKLDGIQAEAEVHVQADASVTDPNNPAYIKNFPNIPDIGADKENTSNKQNSLTPDGTGVKFPTVDAVNTGLSTKISGTGTTDFVQRSTGSGTIGNSQIFDNGTRIGLGTITPQSKLNVHFSDAPFGSEESFFITTPNTILGLGGTFDYNYIQSGAQKPLRINTLGNSVFIGGKTILNKLTDDGNALQVNGNITATPATLSNQVVVKSQLDNSFLNSGSDYIYVAMSGQSNAVGETNNTGGNISEINERVEVWNTLTNSWEVATNQNTHDPLQNGYNNSNNLGWQFCKNIEKRTGKRVRYVLSALGGQSITQWESKTSFQYLKLINALINSGVPKVDYFLWLQGEADNNMSHLVYENKFKTFISNIRSDAPFQMQTLLLIGELKKTGTYDSQNATFFKMEQETGEYFKLVSSTDFVGYDPAHYTGVELDIFASRFFHAAYGNSKKTYEIISSKANLANPNFTGTPTAPTATAGTNTTQIATTAFVTNADSGNVKTTGDQAIAGVKNFQNTIQVLNNSSTGDGINLNNNSTGDGIELSNTSTGIGIRSVNASTGIGIRSANSSGGTGIESINSSTGVGVLANTTSSGTGFNYVGQNNDVTTFTVDKFGKIGASKLNLSTTSGSQSVGNANMVGGTVTITTTAATTSSVIMLTRNSVGITGFLTYTTANGSFTINSNVIGDAGVISYVIFN